MRKTIDRLIRNTFGRGMGHCATVRLEREIVYHDNLQHVQDPIKSCLPGTKNHLF